MNTTEKGHTAYVILAKATSAALEADFDGWIEAGRFAARTSEAAIRAYCEQTASTSAMVLVAVPSRSFQPVKVTPKVATTLVIEDVQP